MYTRAPSSITNVPSTMTIVPATMTKVPQPPTIINVPSGELLAPVGLDASRSFTSSSATGALVYSIPLYENSYNDLTVICMARDTGSNIYTKTHASKWTRSTGGAVRRGPADSGPDAVDEITVAAGLYVVGLSTSLGVYWSGSDSIHTAGEMQISMVTTPWRAAT